MVARGLLVISSFFIVVVVSFPARADAYKNYTVGDSLGWYDKLESPKVDYQKWAANKNFSLGDFLIFNTDNNHSVIQTNNLTTYALCADADAADNDTTQWSSADPSSTTPHPVSVAVPLRKVGPTYFFSGDYDGEQCENGQRFKINVTYGHGLPPSDDSMAPTSPESDDDAAPDTLVPANFDHPKDIDADDDASEGQESGSVSFWVFSKLFGVRFNGLVLLVVGFIFSS